MDARNKNLDSLEAAIAYQKDKRIQSVPNKFRATQNTDAELNSEEKKRKRSEKRTLKIYKENASLKNSSHLVDLFKSKQVLSGSENENSDCDSTDEVTQMENQLPEDNTERKTEDIVGSPSSPAAETINKLIVKRTRPSPIQVSRAAGTAGQIQSILINSNKQDKYPLSVSSLSSAIQFQAKATDISSKIEQKPPIVVDLKRKCQKPSTVTTPSNLLRTDVLLDAASKSSVINKIVKPQERIPLSISTATKLHQQNVDLKQKGKKSPTVTAASNPLQTNVLLDSVSKSSVINKIEQKQTTVLNQKPKGHIPLSISTATIPLQPNVALDTAVVVASVAVNKSITSYPAIVGSKKRLANSSENVTGKKQKVVPSTAISSAECEVIPEYREMVVKIKKLEKENAQLKIDKDILAERNSALQSALVICTKSIPVPLEFEEKDGGRLYRCGIYLNENACKVLDAITDDRQYCNGLITAVFGREILKKSSVTGAVSNRTKAEAKTPLDPIGLTFIYDMMTIRTNNSALYSRTKVNKIINKKIANLLAGENPRPRKIKAKGSLRNMNECDEEDDEQSEEDDKVVENKEEQEQDEVSKQDEANKEGDEIGEYEDREQDEDSKDEVNEESSLQNDERGIEARDIIHVGDTASAEHIDLVMIDEPYCVTDMSDFSDWINFDL